jgi:hypothetical protein
MAALLIIAGLAGVVGSGWNLFLRADAASSRADQTLFGASCLLMMAAARLFHVEGEAGDLRRLLRRLLEEGQQGKLPPTAMPTREGTAEPGAPADGGREQSSP